MATDASNSNGQSRAAKKRAKKKQKVQHEETTAQRPKVSKDDTPSTSDTDVALSTDLNKAQKPDKDCGSFNRENVHNGKIEKSKVTGAVASKQVKNISPDILAPDNCTNILQIINNDESDPILAAMTSTERSQCVLSYLLQPAGVSPTDFYGKYWEKQPLYVSCAGEKSDRLDGLLSLEMMRTITKTNTLYYGRDLNVTRCQSVQVDNKVDICRVSLEDIHPNPNPDSIDPDDNFVRVVHKELWPQYDKSGCTIRMLCPQQYSKNLHALLSLLELEWGCMVGANAYLTPPNRAQGFAPHYDDIEAFILQVQGRKRWKVYAPLNKNEILPRNSSEDYYKYKLADAECVLDVVLKPGDVLYMPRGWIHYACTLAKDEHDDSTATGSASLEPSLHITVSAMQHWAWADFLEVLLPEALDNVASSESTLLRQGLPRCFLEYMGNMHDKTTQAEPIKQCLASIEERMKSAAAADSNGDNSDEDSDDLEKEQERLVEQLREKFKSETKKRIMKVAMQAMDMVDAACDQMAKRFLSDRLPPALTHAEKSRTIDSIDTKGFTILPATRCRLVRPGIARLVLEDDGKAVVYHCNDNSCVYHEKPLSPMEFELDDGPALEQLLTTVEPNWIMVADLIHDSIEDKVGIAQALFDEGILSVDTQQMDDDEEED